VHDVNDPAYEKKCAEIERRFNVCFGDITVFCGRDVREGTLAAYRKALALLNSGEFHKVLVINSGSTTRWALRLAREVDSERIGADPNKHQVVVHTAVSGALSKQVSELDAMIERYGFDVVMINSWEFTSQHPRYKDDLLFRLREWVEDRQLTLVVYSHFTKVETKPGVFQRGTLGKLSVVAGKIVILAADEVVIEAKSKPQEQSQFVQQEPVPRRLPDRSEQYVGVHGVVYAEREVELELVE
jgi:hypothetical protein